MKLKILAIATIVTITGSAAAVANLVVRQPSHPLCFGCKQQKDPAGWDKAQSAAFQTRSLAIREKLAAVDLDKLDAWWRREKIGDPHKYLLPVIISRLSLGDRYSRQDTWNVLQGMSQDKSSLYHFRSVYDVRLFFLFRDQMPPDVKADYRSMLMKPRVLKWIATGTENHMFMHRLSGLALMDGSGWLNEDPASAATIEAWLRSELNKFLTIGQGEFHSSTYYGYSIGGWLNLYDFASTPELRQLAASALDWYATNMALRLSWGTAGGGESRGFDRGTWSSGLSAVAWMWWGDGVEPVQHMNDKQAQLALNAALSKYRPNPRLRSLARKQVPLPFEAQASHPVYYSYHKDNQFWENFYVTDDYSLGTLLVPQRSYQVKGTINAQYATYKLVVRDRQGLNNAVVSLGGTFHSPLATGSSPGDEYVQSRSAVIYQLRLNGQDKAANVPARSHLVLPVRYGKPQQHGDWYIWRIQQTWLCARPWGERISLEPIVSKRKQEYQALAASGTKTAWITDVARVADYPNFESIARALDKTRVDDQSWDKFGKLAYTSLMGDRLVMVYEPQSGIGRARINDRERVLKDLPVLDSPYIRESLHSGVLEFREPVSR